MHRHYQEWKADEKAIPHHTADEQGVFTEKQESAAVAGEPDRYRQMAEKLSFQGQGESDRISCHQGERYCGQTAFRV